MKTNAIVRIILFSLAILILLGVLITSLSLNLFSFVRDSFSEDVSNLPMADDGFTNTSVADAGEIQNLEIEWVSGNIRILRDENASRITVSEINNGKEKYNMVCRQSGNTLRIQFCEDSIHFSSFGINADFSKDLVVAVPENWECNTLEINAASADVNMKDLTVDEVSFDGASGKCVFDNCHVGILDLDTASGDVEFTGTLEELDCDAVSADFDAVLSNVPDSLDFDGVSGDMDVTLPENAGFTVSIESISGDFSSDFPTTNSDGKHICGDGHCRIQAEGVSGNIIIRNGGSGSTASVTACTESNCTDSSHHHSEKHH